MIANACAHGTVAVEQRLLEVPPCERHAADFDDVRMLGEHVIIRGRRVHLEIPTVVGQHLQRPVTIARPREVVHHLA
jgi:hypothetical protein